MVDRSISKKTLNKPIFFSSKPDDCASPDVTVIEDDDLNLDELMKQKELLQARLVAYMGESEDDRSKRTEISNKKIAESEIITLDYSSEEKDEKSRKRHRSDSKNVKESQQDKSRKAINDEKMKRDEKMKEAHRSRKDNDNRYKEDLRKEIDRDKVRFFREREKIKDDRDRRNNMDRRNTDGNRQRAGVGNDMNKMRRLSTDGRDRRDYSRDDDYRQDRGRNRYSYQDKNKRGRNVDQKDKFKGSLSEGLKDKNSSSSGSEMDITVNDEEDDEEKIIAQRRKQRMELLKKLGNTEETDKYIDEKESSSPIVAPNLETYELNDGTLSPTDVEVQPPYDSLTPPFPPGIKADVSNKEIIDDKNALKGKEIKRSEWDMFAEQDIDSNFDVSTFFVVF